MKIFLLKVGINPKECLEQTDSITDGLQGELNSAKMVEGIVDNDLFISDLQMLDGTLNLEMDRNKHILSSRLANGGVILCFAGTISRNNYDNKSNYSWLVHLNADLGPENVSGQEINFYSTFPFISLFNKISNEFSHQVIFNRNPGGNYYPIAKNKSNHIVAFYAIYGKGHIFILPQPKDKDKFVKYFIDKILPTLKLNFEISSGSEEPMPEEIKNLLSSGQEGLKRKMLIQSEKIKQEQDKLDNLSLQYTNLEQWKDLLWQTGLPLENIVKTFFRFLGLTLEKKNSDLYGEYQGKEIFIEVKGNKGCIDHSSDFRQIEERKNYESKNPQNTYALLVDNAFN